MLEKQQTGCSHCHDAGYLIGVDGSVICAENCNSCSFEWEEQQKISFLINNYNNSLIPAKYHNFKGSVAPLPESVTAWLNQPNQCLVLHGHPNSEKTNCGIGILLHSISNYYSAGYIDCSDYIDALKSMIHSNTIPKLKDMYVKKIEFIKTIVARYDFIVFDNINDKSLTTWAHEQYTALFRLRNKTGKPTILIANEEPDALIETFKDVLQKDNSSPIKVEFFEKGTSAEIIDFAEISKIKCAKEETTFLHLWAREGLFRVVSKRERGKLSQKSVIDETQIIEKAEIHEYISWSGYHIILDGPVLDYNDANLLAVLMRIYHIHSFRDGVIYTTFNEISSLLGMQRGSKNNDIIRRGLMRLNKCRPTIRKGVSKDAEKLWVDGFINSVEIIGKARGSQVKIELNKNMIPFYHKNSFAFLNIPILLNASQYGQGIYRFLMSHRDKYKYIKLDRWRSILGVSPETTHEWFKRCMKDAIAELIKHKILEDRSNIDKTETVHTYLTEQEKICDISPRT
jgi:hypothetical protein